MGAVFQATHRVTGKRFAVKWLLPEVSGQGDAAQRFIREAQVAGRFEHPHVVEVYDLGNEAGSFYMVMELLEGESLADRVTRAGPMTVTDTCRLLIPCMHGVAEAHSAGIVHRDLKPANIFICHASKHGRECAKVLDFGISKISGLPGGDLSGMTKSGTLIGTPHYMPLEQMRGKSIDQRADIYALGVVLYQMLSGRLPYQLNNFGDLLLAMASEAPQPLERAVRGLPSGMVRVIDKALSRSPDDRYPNLDAMLVALEPFAPAASPRLQLPAAARRLPDANPERTWSLRRALTAALGVLLAAAAAVSFGLLSHHGVAHRERPIRETPRALPASQPSAAAGLADRVAPEVPASVAPEPEPEARQSSPIAVRKPWRRQPAAARPKIDLNEIPPEPSHGGNPPPEPAWRVPVMSSDEF
jgi:serine/threonine protein kinase